MMRTLGWILGLCLLVGATGCATCGRSIHGVDNFDVVKDKVILRGAQPSEAGVSTLKEMGVATIINVRNDPAAWEKQAVEAAGMRYIWIPMNAANVEPAKVQLFLKSIADCPQPIFVHCWQGRDRTGLCVAAYRMTTDTWASTRAISELRTHGYNWALFPGIEAFLKAYAPAKTPSIAAAAQ
jgi:protein tyrosine phosphatase (PTP) superfamily phosphohydrolase (DUF442 family)